ncbi:MAG: sulfatase-like hydrolase/transferase [Gammaproteobacteria bacterium]
MALWLGGCGSSKPNVLIVTIDTLRVDHLGCYGYSLAHTPTIDRLAAEGVRYTDAIAAAPITMPSHSTIMTGLFPPAHGVRDNGEYALGDDAVTLAERLKAAGYETRAFVSALVLNRRYNLAQGFDDYDDDLWAEDDPKLFMIRDRPARRTVDRVLEWFEQWRQRDERKPFFAWLHLFDPHQPYQPPGWAAAITALPYDAEIASADHELGRLLDRLRETQVLDNTIVVFTADHGESLGEHEEKTHAIFIYDATVHVPLIVRYPGALPAGKRYDGPVRHVDIVPTLLALLGLPGAEETQGIDLTPATLDKVPPPMLAQYSESILSEVGFGMAPLYGVRFNGYKWIRAPKPELYDLRADPHELKNLYVPDDSRAAEYDAELSRLLADSERRAVKSRDSPMNKETLEALQSLGYLQGSETRKSMSGIDPKDGVRIYNRLEQARHLAQAEKWPQSEAALREILNEIPGHISARNVLALTLLRQDKFAEARDEYLRSLQDDPQQSRVYLMLGTIALFNDQLSEAENDSLEALRLSPQFVEAASNLGMIALLRGDEAGAKAWYDRAVALDPTFPLVYRRIADLYYEKKEYRDALRYYQKTLERSPTDYRALLQAGNSARFSGDFGAADRYYRKASDLRKDAWAASYNLACLYAVQGDSQNALDFLRQSLARGMDPEHLQTVDQDLDSLRPLPEFAALKTTAAPAATTELQ